MNSTPRPILYIIVVALAFLSSVGVCALAGTLFYKSYADPAVLSAFIAITSGCIGSLSTLLANMRQPQADTTTVITPASPATPSNINVEPQPATAPAQP